MSKNKDMQQIWENYSTPQSESTLAGVTCECKDCEAWREGDLSAASSINLGKDPADSIKVICETYTPRQEEELEIEIN